jgi:hypothetical protein
MNNTTFLRVGLFCFVGLGPILAAPQSAGGAVAVSQPLPVLVSAAGGRLDRAAVEHLHAVLPPEGQPLTMTNVWSHGAYVFATDQESGGALLLLSNVWTYGASGVPEDAFLRGRGLTNAPIEVAIPGGAGYYLMIAGNGVLPFVGRRGTTAPAAIWAWPGLPVKLEGSKPRVADISQCSLVSFTGGKVNLSGWAGSFGVRQKWCLSAEGGLLRLLLELSVERD